MKVSFQNISKQYKGKYALKNFTTELSEGVYGLLGANGAGKTTLMKTIATLLPKQSGSITVCGIPIENAKAIRQIIGYLPQDFSMYPNMSVYECLDYLGALSGMSADTRRSGIDRLLKKVNLFEQKKKKVRALSGGMKRRLGIAQALLHNPKVLIVDEPTAGLDPKGRDEILDYIAKLHEETGITIILVSHSMEDVAKYVSRIMVMNRGELLYDDTPKNVFTHYQELEEVGLAAPQVTYLMAELRKRGVNVPLNVTTVEEAAKEILKVMK